jgi:hypothetical protein
MFDIQPADYSATQSKSLARALRNTPLVLPTQDYEMLQKHLEACDCALRPSAKLLAYVLANKLMNTRSMDDMAFSDLVIGGSLVTYAVDGTEPQTGLLIHRARAGLPGGVIPVASLLGATLIGMKVGQRAPLLFEDGSIGRLHVIDVTTAT